MSVAVAFVAGCGAGGGSSTSTAPTPPDRLVVTVGGGVDAVAFALDCAIADRAACSGILRALGDAQHESICTPVDRSSGRIAVTGTIGGSEVRSLLTRRTDCEVRTYDRVIAALG